MEWTKLRVSMAVLLVLMGPALLAWSDVTVVGSGQAPTQQPRTTWSGVYTEVQGIRGGAVYEEKCASCHGASLEGGEMAPALVGGEFRANWESLSLADLFDRVRITMPLSAPQSLSRSEVADVIAYVLMRSRFPAGQSELSHDREVLRGITYESSPTTP